MSENAKVKIEISYMRRLYLFTTKQPTTDNANPIIRAMRVSISPRISEKTSSGVSPNAGFLNILCMPDESPIL